MTLEYRRGSQAPEGTPRSDFHEIESSEPVEYQEMIQQLREAIADYFPEDAGRFQPPSFGRFVESFEVSISAFSRDSTERQMEDHDLVADAFIAAAAIRYVDNFLDEVLWPARKEYDPKIFEDLVKGFLERSFIIAKVYEPNMPREILRLPFLELELELHPSQASFDQHVRDLFYFKSYDMSYVESLWFHDKRKHKTMLSDIAPDAYIGVAIRDFARDFMDDRYLTDTDFNLFRFIRENHLDPKVLKDFLQESVEKLDEKYEEVSWSAFIMQRLQEWQEERGIV